MVNERLTENHRHQPHRHHIIIVVVVIIIIPIIIIIVIVIIIVIIIIIIVVISVIIITSVVVVDVIIIVVVSSSSSSSSTSLRLSYSDDMEYDDVLASLTLNPTRVSIPSRSVMVSYSYCSAYFFRTWNRI